jgi:hypothetical protein
VQLQSWCISSFLISEQATVPAKDFERTTELGAIFFFFVAPKKKISSRACHQPIPAPCTSCQLQTKNSLITTTQFLKPNKLVPYMIMIMMRGANEGTLNDPRNRFRSHNNSGQIKEGRNSAPCYLRVPGLSSTTVVVVVVDSGVDGCCCCGVEDASVGDDRSTNIHGTRISDTQKRKKNCLATFQQD